MNILTGKAGIGKSYFFNTLSTHGKVSQLNAKNFSFLNACVFGIVKSPLFEFIKEFIPLEDPDRHLKPIKIEEPLIGQTIFSKPKDLFFYFGDKAISLTDLERYHNKTDLPLDNDEVGIIELLRSYHHEKFADILKLIALSDIQDQYEKNEELGKIVGYIKSTKLLGLYEFTFFPHLYILISGESIHFGFDTGLLLDAQSFRVKGIDYVNIGEGSSSLSDRFSLSRRFKELRLSQFDLFSKIDNAVIDSITADLYNTSEGSSNLVLKRGLVGWFVSMMAKHITGNTCLINTPCFESDDDPLNGFNFAGYTCGSLYLLAETKFHSIREASEYVASNKPWAYLRTQRNGEFYKDDYLEKGDPDYKNRLAMYYVDGDRGLYDRGSYNKDKLFMNSINDLFVNSQSELSNLSDIGKSEAKRSTLIW